jgi:dihydroorotate dehydrogenase (fumarate)
MDLATTYLGLKLPHPFMPGASPMVDDLDTVKRLEDAGASAIVMHSLFEEQITREQIGTIEAMEIHAGAFAEALSYFPEPEEYRLGPELYLEQIRKIKQAVKLPVIGSLNGVTLGGWLEYARKIEQAGADALELNVYYLAAKSWEAGSLVERRILEMVHAVRSGVKIPVAVKLSPFFSSLGHFASELDRLKTDGLVLFNRFYQPDIDPEEMEVVPSLVLSDSSELLLRLRWLAILSGRLKTSLAVSGGVHTGLDAVKAVMTGADAVQLVSAILKRGPKQLAAVRQEFSDWMEKHEYESVAQMKGSMSLLRSPDPASFERANYMRILQSFRAESVP